MVAGTVGPTDEIGDSARSLWESTLEALPRVGVALAIVAAGWLVGRGVRWAKQQQYAGEGATPSLRAALHGTDEIRPAGNLRRMPVVDRTDTSPMTYPDQARR